MRTTAEVEAWRSVHPGERIDLSGANLSGADLSGANLAWASLIGANLCGANMEGADLLNARLIIANLEGANLTNATIIGASLEGANLEGANLSGADLKNASLIGANLCGANMDTVQGIYLLPIEDPRGYRAYAQVYDRQPMIGSGCRYFTVKDALSHWGDAYDGDREIGDAYIEGLKELSSDRFQSWLKTQGVSDA